MGNGERVFQKGKKEGDGNDEGRGVSSREIPGVNVIPIPMPWRGCRRGVCVCVCVV